MTADGVHKASLHTPKQYGAVEQGPDGSATLGLKPARAIGATTVFKGEQSAAVCRVESVETAPRLV